MGEQKKGGRKSSEERKRTYLAPIEDDVGGEDNTTDGIQFGNGDFFADPLGEGETKGEERSAFRRRGRERVGTYWEDKGEDVEVAVG